MLCQFQLIIYLLSLSSHLPLLYRCYAQYIFAELPKAFSCHCVCNFHYIQNIDCSLRHLLYLMSRYDESHSKCILLCFREQIVPICGKTSIEWKTVEIVPMYKSGRYQ